MAGRFAPSPTGPLHVGNLRTALIAWLFARSAGDAFRLRMEDLDRVTSATEHERSQRHDLVALGIDWDGDVWRQSERFDVYEQALDVLRRAGLTYECYCSRREIREAAAAPHGDSALRYPGRCRELTERQRVDRRAQRPPAIRFRADASTMTVDDVVAGQVDGLPADVVLRRNDGVPAYNLAVVVDDAAAGVDLVVRGDDLLSSTPSQIAIGSALGLPTPRYAHVPLVVGPDGERLAKRDGAITLSALADAGIGVAAVRSALAVFDRPRRGWRTGDTGELIDRFDVATSSAGRLVLFAARTCWRMPNGLLGDLGSVPNWLVGLGSLGAMRAAPRSPHGPRLDSSRSRLVIVSGSLGVATMLLGGTAIIAASSPRVVPTTQSAPTTTTTRPRPWPRQRWRRRHSRRRPPSLRRRLPPRRRRRRRQPSSRSPLRSIPTSPLDRAAGARPPASSSALSTWGSGTAGPTVSTD